VRRSPFATALMFLSVATGPPGVAADPPKPADLSKPVQLTAQDDHKKMLEQLKIKEIRRGADGNPNSPNAANKDESKATPYPDLPDPLTRKDGKKVTNAEQWKERRAEIVEEFDREVYGRVP